ncbi:unnamed protein product, partial [Ectocarpus sp. 4 AP-2014]
VSFAIVFVVLLLQVLSSTTIALFIKKKNTRSTVAKNEPLRIVAIDTGAGAVQINPEDGDFLIGSISAGVEDGHKRVGRPDGQYCVETQRSRAGTSQGGRDRHRQRRASPQPRGRRRRGRHCFVNSIKQRHHGERRRELAHLPVDEAVSDNGQRVQRQHKGER